MVVTVNLHTVLQNVTGSSRTSQVSLELPENATVQMVLEQMQIAIPAEELLLAVNGKVVPAEHALEDGDALDLIPAISGG